MQKNSEPFRQVLFPHQKSNVWWFGHILWSGNGYPTYTNILSTHVDIKTSWRWLQNIQWYEKFAFKIYLIKMIFLVSYCSYFIWAKVKKIKYLYLYICFILKITYNKLTKFTSLDLKKVKCTMNTHKMFIIIIVKLY